VAPVLAVDVRNQAIALEQAAILKAVVTTYAYKESGVLERAGRALDGLLGSSTTMRLKKRELRDVHPSRLYRCTAKEVLRLVRRNCSLLNDNQVLHSDAAFAAVDRYASAFVRNGVRLVLAREDACIRSFHAARQQGAHCLYDLPTSHHVTVRRIMEVEEGQFPGVSTEPPIGDFLTTSRTARKDAELQAAHHILVPSRFVKDSLSDAGICPSRVTVIPFGSESTWIADTPPIQGDTVLHVGNLSLRKGTHRLLRAWKKLGAHRTYRLRLIGSMQLSRTFLSDYAGCYEYLGRRPREELREHYRSACLFVLPAAAEGFAIVIQEALSCGLPIIASQNSGADGFLTHGHDCLLHPFGDDDALCDSLDWMLAHPRERAEMGRRALEKARLWTWLDYRNAFLTLVQQLQRA
jgi:glycosyltransferase involved in cell wall biosynthesis